MAVFSDKASQIIQNTLYPLARYHLFTLEPEVSHARAMAWLKLSHRIGLSRKSRPLSGRNSSLCGLNFLNPVGLAAGLDKDGRYIDALGSLGFGAIEVGTVTPKPQSGNPRPRLYRLSSEQAIINRMGFNNQGVDALVQRLQRRSFQGVLGVNLGKNRATTSSRAADDYCYGMQQVYPWCDYIAINISSPNTAGLRDLQHEDQLTQLLNAISRQQRKLEQHWRRDVPVFLKVAPDLDDQAIEWISRQVKACGIAGLIVSNTTVSRAQVQQHLYAEQAGGLSGAPLRATAESVLIKFRQAAPDCALIGVGGIMSGSDGEQRLMAGADLIQIYTGFIYTGPELVGDIVTRTANLSSMPIPSVL